MIFVERSYFPVEKQDKSVKQTIKYIFTDQMKEFHREVIIYFGFLSPKKKSAAISNYLRESQNIDGVKSRPLLCKSAKSAHI